MKGFKNSYSANGNTSAPSKSTALPTTWSRDGTHGSLPISYLQHRLQKQVSFSNVPRAHDPSWGVTDKTPF